MAIRTIEEINEKLKKQEAVIVTADEFKKMTREKERIDQVDVVTTATFGIMSGIAVILSVPVAEPGQFERAKKVYLNGVPAYPGPCPNERLGKIDLMFFGTDHSNKKYGGGHLLRDIVEGKEIDIKIETTDNMLIVTSFNLNDLEFARLIGTRTASKNYMAFVNSYHNEVNTIFSVSPLRGLYKEATACGCGEINPLQNDPALKTMGIGSRILVNGTTGFIIGTGTNSSVDKPTLSISADIKGMNPDFMGGFNTSSGPECITSIAVPIPVLDNEVLENLKILDENIPLPIAEIHTRDVFAKDSYSSFWQNDSLNITYDKSKCYKLFMQYDPCKVEQRCPTGAFSRKYGIDSSKCFSCGACALNLCSRKAFNGYLGSIRLNGKKIPIVLRQSSRGKALLLSRILKNQMEKGDFLLSSPVSDTESQS